MDQPQQQLQQQQQPQPQFMTSTQQQQQQATAAPQPFFTTSTQEHKKSLTNPTNPINQLQQSAQVSSQKRQTKQLNAQNMAKEKEEQSQMLGIQAQNIYLLNYLNKLEFLLQETVIERKRDKKQKRKQLTTIMQAIQSKPGISKDLSTLEYYIGLTHGVDDKRGMESEDASYSDSDKETVQMRILGQRQNRERKEGSLLNVLGFQTTIKDDEDRRSSSEYKTEKELKLDFTRKDLPILEQQLDKKKKGDISEDDYLKQIEQMRSKIIPKEGRESGITNEEEDSINEYQVSDFMRKEWDTLTKYASKLVQPNVAQKYQQQ